MLLSLFGWSSLLADQTFFYFYFFCLLRDTNKFQGTYFMFCVKISYLIYLFVYLVNFWFLQLLPVEARRGGTAVALGHFYKVRICGVLITVPSG